MPWPSCATPSAHPEPFAILRLSAHFRSEFCRMTREGKLRTREGHLIRYALYGSELPAGSPGIVYAHGLKGFKDWGFVPYCGDFFARKGFRFLAFDFSHNGVSEGQPGEISDLDAFEANTYSLEISELHQVLAWMKAQYAAPLGLVGHSRGGGMALLAAAHQAPADALATWAAISTVERWTEASFQQGLQQGYLETLNQRTGQRLRIGAALLEEVSRYGKTRLNILEAAKSLDIPLLILHGEADSSVPMHEAEQLNLYANPALAQYRLIPGGDHTFGARHPFAGSTPALELALAHTLSFFQQHLARP